MNDCLSLVPMFREGPRGGAKGKRPVKRPFVIMEALAFPETPPWGFSAVSSLPDADTWPPPATREGGVVGVLSGYLLPKQNHGSLSKKEDTRDIGMGAAGPAGDGHYSALLLLSRSTQSTSFCCELEGPDRAVSGALGRLQTASLSAPHSRPQTERQG